MDKTKKVLLVGETWMTAATHYKGFDDFRSTTFHSGAEPLIAALADSEFEIVHMSGHEAPEALPFDAAGLSDYDAILLSDIGANSLLLHPDVWLRGQTVPNRLKLLRDWTADGGNLGMIGGYLTFQGIDGKGRWRRTPVEEALPVDCLPYDDRIEAPEGFRAEIVQSRHPIVEGLGDDWPALLGANEVTVKEREGVEVIARLPDDFGGHPLIVTGTYGKGRTLAWTSDVGPHWLPQTFVDWPGYAVLWRNMLRWLTDR